MGKFSENFKKKLQIKNTNFELESAQLYWKRELADQLLRSGLVRFSGEVTDPESVSATKELLNNLKDEENGTTGEIKG
jgi:hypothetical protein